MSNNIDELRQRKRAEYWLPEDMDEDRGPNPWAGFAGIIGYAVVVVALTGGAIAFIEAMVAVDPWLDGKTGLGVVETGGGIAGLALIGTLLAMLVRRMRGS